MFLNKFKITSWTIELDNQYKLKAYFMIRFYLSNDILLQGRSSKWAQKREALRTKTS